MVKTVCLLTLGIGIGVVGIQLFNSGSISSVLPYLVILICPLMMLFMGHGMDHKNDESHTKNKKGDL